MLLVAGCAAPPPPTPPSRQATIAAVEFLPEMRGVSQSDASVLFQDGALATAVPGGTLWTFGDTFLGSRDADGKPSFRGDRSNTMAWLPQGATEWPPRLEYLRDADGVAMAPLPLVEQEEHAKRRLWPLAGYWRQDRAYLFYGLIDVTGPGPWGFAPVGVGLAVAERPFGPYRRLRVGDRTAAWPIDPTTIVAVDGDLLLYAPRRFGAEQGPSGLLIARVAAAAIEDPTQYRFFAGRDAAGAVRWVDDVQQAAPAADDVAAQASVVQNGYLGGYLLSTSSDFTHHDRIRLRHAPTPFGPFTPVGPGDGRIAAPERAGEKTQLIYCTMLHPEMDADGGRVITLSFCRLLERQWALTSPEGVRVTLAR